MPDKEKEKDGQKNLLVAVRVRPLNGVEVENEKCSEIVHVLDENLVVLKDPNDDQDDILRANRTREKQYIFDCAFGPSSSQADVYTAVAKPLIENVISGYNATVFAYGATGAGKTFTMLGTDREPGIMALALNDLFYAMEKTKEDMKYKVSMSYLEIYNEMIRDLLNPSSGFLELREDTKGVVVAGISEVQAQTTSEVMNLLVMGNRRRTCEPTAANKTSSRSHAILQVTVNQKSRVKNTIDEFRIGKLFMIDLAGSERAAQTKNRGKRMIEGAHINRSLLALGNCINALSENRSQYVNYRDSKLTRLLKDSLGGNCRTVMIAHISPASVSFEETRNTLLYADRAKNIKTNVKPNQFSVSYHIAQYTNIIADLRKEIFRLKLKISEHDPDDNGKSKNAKQKDKNPEEMNRLRDQLVSTFKEQMDIRRKLIELEDTAMQITVDVNRYMLIIDEWEQDKARRGGRRITRSSRKSSDALPHGDLSSVTSAAENDHFGLTSDFTDDKTAQPSKEDHKRATLPRSDSLEDVESKDLDTEKEKTSKVLNDENSDVFAEPEEVSFAREEISTLISEEKRTSELKVDLQGKLQQTRKEVELLEELLPKKISSEENREILGLLCKVHELEITNAELQSHALLRENVLRQKDVDMNKYESRQRLCDEIIQMQRSVIKDAGVECSSELEALYDVYMQRSAEDRESFAVSKENAQATINSIKALQKASLLAGLNQRMMPLERVRLFTVSKLSPLSEETPSRLMSLQNSPVKMSRATPSSHTQVSDDVFEAGNSQPVALPAPKRTKKVNSLTDEEESVRSSPTALSSIDDKSDEVKSDRPASPMFAMTKRISELAARRRVVMDKSNANSRTSVRTGDELSSKANSYSDMRASEAAASVKKVQGGKGISVKASLSLSDLSVIDKRLGEVSSEDSTPMDKKRTALKTKTKKTPQRRPQRLRSASLDDTKVLRMRPRRTRKEELQEAARQRAAVAAAAQAASRIRRNPGHNTEGRRAGGARQPKKHVAQKATSLQGTDALRDTEVGRTEEKPASRTTNSSNEGELLTFFTNVTPPSTVQQHGVRQGSRGQTIQKRYRGPPEISGTDSNQSTPRLRPRKNPPKTGKRSIDELSVSGVAVRPAGQNTRSRR